MVNYNGCIVSLQTSCQKPPQENIKKPSANTKLFKKSKKIIPTKNNFDVIFASKLDVLTHMPREARQEVIFGVAGTGG